MQKIPIHTNDAPAAVGPYSQAIKCGDLVFCSGQIPLDPTSNTLLSGTIAEETHRVLKNLMAVLAASGSGPADVVKTTIFLKSLGDFAAVNEVYSSYFPKPYPARACVEVAGLPKGARVEIEAIAKVSK